MTITTADLDLTLLKVSDLTKILATTEPLSQVSFVPDVNDGDKVSFELPPGWNVGIKEEHGTHITPATMAVNGVSYQMTKDAVMQATSSIGLTRDYVSKTPGHLIGLQLNYWYSTMPNREMKLLATTQGDEKVGLAFVKAGVQPIPNLAILDKVLSTVYSTFGEETEVFVDYKWHHDLRLTQFRLILPEQGSTIVTASDDPHKWSIGLDVQNSFTAEAGLNVRGYMFSWNCTNGATSTHSKGKTFSRKGSPDLETALEWVEARTENVLDSLHHELDNVEALTKVEIEGEVNHTMMDIFEHYKVPAASRQEIMAELVEAEDLTMYGVMAAITAAANYHDLTPAVVQRLLEVGGDLPSAAPGRCTNCHRLPIG